MPYAPTRHQIGRAHMPLQTLRIRIERVIDVRPGEWPALLIAFIYFFCLLAGYYVLRPVRDTMGVVGGVDNLQWLFTATFGAMLCATPVFGWVVRRYPRRIFLPAVYAFFIVNLLLFAVLFRVPGAEAWTARAFFVWLSVFNLFVVSVFWSFMVDIFTSKQAARLFGVIAAGGSAGALAGPWLTAMLATTIGTEQLLLVSAALMAGALACVRALARHRFREGMGDATADKALGGGILEGVTTFLTSPYLLGIGAYIALYTLTSTFLYFQQAELVSGAFESDDRRTQVFALIDLATNGLTLALQLFVTGRLLSWAGVRTGLVVLPLLTVAGFLALAAGPVLMTLAAFQTLRRAASYAIARPARETLFTAVPEVQKYKSKNFVDTVVYRGGDAASGWLYAGLAGLGFELATLALIAAPIALVWAGVGWALGGRHRAWTREEKGETP